MQFKRVLGLFEGILDNEVHTGNVASFLKSLDYAPSEEDYSTLEEKGREIVDKLESVIKKKKIGAEVFLGGSFAKRTMVKKDIHDIDIYVRFDWRYGDLSSILEKIVNSSFGKRKNQVVEKIHGSRDYFKVIFSDSLTFEIIPVLSIKHPRESRNVTDLSYFHVKYFKKFAKKQKQFNGEVALAKTFCRAHGVYGAESYIQGFSGYALECLIAHYGSFLKMLRSLVKVKDRMIIDLEKQYSKKESPLILMNESKLMSPIVLIDPTWRERNALAALSKESFEVFQKAAREFLAHPRKSDFVFHPVSRKSFDNIAHKKKAEILHLNFKTDKQAGDIAGTKLKKFFTFFGNELTKEFDVFSHIFQYNEKENAEVFYIVKAKKEIVEIGPPVNLAKHAKAFRKCHKQVFEKNGFLHTYVKTAPSARAFLEHFRKNSSKKMEDMHIIGIEEI